MDNYNFAKWLYEQELDANKDNILAPSINAQRGLQFLIHYLLGDNWTVNYPAGQEQINTEAIHDILYKYSKQYRKDIKQLKKELKKC